MRKHSDAIRKIKVAIKEFAAEARKIRGMIHRLKYDENGRRKPETGPTRCFAREDYVLGVRPKARAHLLAYGLLRGVSYRAMEPYGTAQHVAHRVYKVIQENVEDPGTRDEWPLDRVLNLLKGVDISLSEAAQ